MSAFTEITARLAPEMESLNKHIRASLTTSNPMMTDVITSYLTTKGKQIRPLLVVMSSRFFAGVGEPDKKVLRAAAAVELLHNATLIHDDVVDDADTRRGCPTINAAWDNHVAVLVGDFFLSTALRESCDTGDLRIIRSISSLGRELATGEMDQICNARFHTLDERAYMTTIGRKTASLFVSCVELGAYAVGVDSDDPALTALRRYAELLGLCFQIRDDIFDYYAVDDAIGKPTGNDLREGKVTLPLLYALTKSGDRRSCEMTELVGKEELSADEITTLIEFAKNAGGIDYAHGVMSDLRQRGRDIIAPWAGNAATTAFESIFDFIIARES